jgi:AhpD family alkylhydroperoxidase
MGNAPAALDGYLSLNTALGKGMFDGKLREQIALAVAESNLCGYCLSAHAFVGGRLGLTPQEIIDARQARSADPRIAAILGTARTIVLQRGELDGSDLADARAAGLTDGDLIELVANVALNIFSNYVNHIAGTVIDFPVVELGSPGAPVCAGR